MPYALAFDAHPVAEIQSPSGLGSYHARFAVGPIAPVQSPSSHTRYVIVLAQGSFGSAADADWRAGARAWKANEAAKQWRRHVFDPSAETHVDALTETVEATLDFIAEFGPESFSLRGARDGAVQAEHLAAALRASSTWSGEIPGWQEALQTAVAAVKSSGGDPADVLFGMV